jgi:hypothetical protein
MLYRFSLVFEWGFLWPCLLITCIGWVIVVCDRGSIPGRGKRISPLASCVQTGSVAHPASVQLVPGVLPQGLKRGRGVTLTTHPHLELRSKMSRSYTSSHQSAFVACSGTALAFLSLFTNLCQHSDKRATRSTPSASHDQERGWLAPHLWQVEWQHDLESRG